MSDKAIRRYVYAGVMHCRWKGPSARGPVCGQPADFFLSWRQRTRSGYDSTFEKPLCEEHARLFLPPGSGFPGVAATESEGPHGPA